MDVRKFQRFPPFTFFGTVTLFKNHILKYFLGNFLKSLKGPPSIFFIFCNQLEFHKAQRVPPFTFFDTVTLFNSFFFIFCHQLEFHKTQRVPPFTILSLRYSADFGRSRLVNQLYSFNVFFSVFQVFFSKEDSLIEDLI